MAANRKEIGNAIWLLILYWRLAGLGKFLQDSECARILGVRQETIEAWRDQLSTLGLITVLNLEDGGLFVSLSFGDSQGFLDAVLQGTDRLWIGPTSSQELATSVIQ